jgi:predicted PolB exonuclease-like 3'-5' exonuclease
MTDHVLVFDIETVRDIGAAARVLGLEGQAEAAVRQALGAEFPKLPLHKIACIGSLVAARGENGWQVKEVAALHIGEHPEQELIAAFAGKVASLKPLLVTFNGATFDLPVLRYRAMVHRISAPGLNARNYFARQSDAALDLCETLASFDQRAKVKLDLLCKTLGFPGKPGGIDGSQVETYVAEGRIAEVAAYCETDVINTYRAWLTYELFHGRLAHETWVASEDNLRDFLSALPEKPHLGRMFSDTVAEPRPAEALVDLAAHNSAVRSRNVVEAVRQFLRGATAIAGSLQKRLEHRHKYR